MSNGKGDKQRPSQVSSKKYRENADRIDWSKKGKKDENTKG